MNGFTPLSLSHLFLSYLLFLPPFPFLFRSQATGRDNVTFMLYMIYIRIRKMNQNFCFTVRREWKWNRTCFSSFFKPLFHFLFHFAPKNFFSFSVEILRKQFWYFNRKNGSMYVHHDDDAINETNRKIYFIASGLDTWSHDIYLYISFPFFSIHFFFSINLSFIRIGRKGCKERKNDNQFEWWFWGSFSSSILSFS